MSVKGSLFFRLMGAFALVILVAVTITYLLANRVAARQFQLYITRGSQVHAVHLAPLLADYYHQTGSWQDVESLLETPWGEAAIAGPGMVRMGGAGLRVWIMERIMGDRLILADAKGRVVADTGGELVGHELSKAERRGGAPISVDGQQVGTLIATPIGPRPRGQQTLEGEFLRSVKFTTLLAGLAAGVIALVLGSFLFLQITAPMRALTAAARRIAGGDLSQRVGVQSQDELGELGQAFNTMAESLARAEASRRNLVADVAHELRTPLSVIQGNLEALLDGVFPPTPENIAAIHEETMLLSRLVEDLRELTLAEAGQLVIKKEPTQVEELIQRTMGNLRPQAAEKEIELVTDLPAVLPTVEADPHRLEQVLRNLLSNGLRYTPAGGRITVAAREAGGEVRIGVADTGPGIPPADLPHVFERFWRGDKARSRAHGQTGLGLAIARQLVEAHGGRIGVESQEGKGTIFTVWLPKGQEVDSGALEVQRGFKG